MKIGANKHIFKVNPYIPGKPIEEVKRELGLKKVVKLASNENPFGPSPKVVQAIIQEVQGLNRYPDGACFTLRKLLARKLKVSENELIFGNGSDEVIVMAVKAFVHEGDEVVIAQPSFLIYEIASTISGANIRAVPLKNFHYDLGGMNDAINARTKIIFIGNPDNPAGTFVGAHQLEKFLNDVPETVLVFIDEAYFEYAAGAKDYPDSIALLKKFKNVIVTRTFSKMYGLAGLRVGYGISNAKIIDCLNRVREPFNVNSLAQAAAVACLKDEKYYKNVARAVEEERHFLYQGLHRLGLRFQKSFTNFILVEVPTDSVKTSQGLLKKGVIIRDMSPWGLRNYVRVTIGSHSENSLFLKALKDVIK